MSVSPICAASLSSLSNACFFSGESVCLADAPAAAASVAAGAAIVLKKEDDHDDEEEDKQEVARTRRTVSK